MALEEPNDKETPQRVNDIDLLVADAIKPFTEHQVIDYVDSSLGRGLVVKANYASSC